MLRKSFNNCSLHTIVKLYITYVRPILEMGGPVWNADLIRDKDLLEKFQRKITRIPFGPVRPSYNERLELSGLPSFVKSKERGDMLICFRAIHNLFGVNLRDLFTLNNNNLRGHSLKLKKENFNTKCRQFFISNRVFAKWNKLPEEIVNAATVNSFKNQYDNYTSAYLNSHSQ